MSQLVEVHSRIADKTEKYNNTLHKLAQSAKAVFWGLIENAVDKLYPDIVLFKSSMIQGRTGSPTSNKIKMCSKYTHTQKRNSSDMNSTFILYFHRYYNYYCLWTTSSASRPVWRSCYNVPSSDVEVSDRLETKIVSFVTFSAAVLRFRTSLCQIS